MPFFHPQAPLPPYCITLLPIVRSRTSSTKNLTSNSEQRMNLLPPLSKSNASHILKLVLTKGFESILHLVLVSPASSLKVVWRFWASTSPRELSCPCHLTQFTVTQGSGAKTLRCTVPSVGLNVIKPP